MDIQELGPLQIKLMMLHRKCGAGGLTLLSTLVAMLSALILCLIGGYFVYGTFLPAEIKEVLPFIVVVPAIITPAISYIFSSLLDRLDTAFDLVAELSTKDPLTGAANRRGFITSAEQNICTFRSEKMCVVGMADLNEFKEINDNYGHKVGDDALSEITRRLEEAVGELGVIGRMGGDEFAFFAFGSVAEMDLLIAAIDADCASFTMDSGVAVSASVGTVFLGEAETIDEALVRADTVLYDIKSSGVELLQAA